MGQIFIIVLQLPFMTKTPQRLIHNDSKQNKYIIDKKYCINRLFYTKTPFTVSRVSSTDTKSILEQKLGQFQVTLGDTGETLHLDLMYTFRFPTTFSKTKMRYSNEQHREI